MLSASTSPLQALNATSTPNNLGINVTTSSSINISIGNNDNLTTNPTQTSGFLSLFEHHEFAQLDEHLYVQLSSTGYALLALITCAGLLVSLISNMIIIYLFTITPSLRRKPSNIIAVNLSLSDLLYCLQWPSVIYCSITQSTKILEYEFVCQSFGFISVSTGMASVLTVSAMSVERAVVISYSIFVKRRFSIRGAWLIIVLIWAVAIASSLPPLFGKFNRYTLDPSKTSCTLDYLSAQKNYKLYMLIVCIAYWIVPTIIIFISYARIIITFKKSSLSLKEIECSSGEACNVGLGSDAETGSFCKPHGSFVARLAHGWQDTRRFRALKNSFGASISNLTGTVCQPSGEQVDDGPTDRKLRPHVGADQRREPIRRQLSNQLGSQSPAGEPLPRLDGCLAEEESAQPEAQSYGLEGKQLAKVDQKDQVNSNNSAQTATADGGNNTNRRHTSESIRLSASFHENIVEAIKRGSRKSDSLRSKYPARSASFRKSANKNLTRAVVQFRLAKMSFYLILLWLVSWTPLAMLAIANSIFASHKTSATAVFIANTMTKLGPAFDVFIYGISHPKIKSKFKQIFKWLFMFGKLPSFSSSRSYTGKVPTSGGTFTTNRLSLRSLQNTTRVLFGREDSEERASGLP